MRWTVRVMGHKSEESPRWLIVDEETGDYIAEVQCRLGRLAHERGLCPENHGAIARLIADLPRLRDENAALKLALRSALAARAGEAAPCA